jgi:hypothetical protein
VDPPVRVALIHLSDRVALANRFLYLEASQAPLIEPKFSVRGPNDVFNAHFARG